VYWRLPFKMQVPSPPNYSKVVRLYLQWSRSVSGFTASRWLFISRNM